MRVVYALWLGSAWGSFPCSHRVSPGQSHICISKHKTCVLLKLFLKISILLENIVILKISIITEPTVGGEKVYDDFGSEWKE